MLYGAATGSLAEVGFPQWRQGAALTVVVAANGYPAAPRKGDRIHGVNAANVIEGVDVILGGTALDDEGNLVTSGGRVLSVTAVGDNLVQARARAYAGVAQISIDGAHHRTDIALKAEQGTIGL